MRNSLIIESLEKTPETLDDLKNVKFRMEVENDGTNSFSINGFDYYSDFTLQNPYRATTTVNGFDLGIMIENEYYQDVIKRSDLYLVYDRMVMDGVTPRIVFKARTIEFYLQGQFKQKMPISVQTILGDSNNTPTALFVLKNYDFMADVDGTAWEVRRNINLTNYIPIAITRYVSNPFIDYKATLDEIGIMKSDGDYVFSASGHCFGETEEGDTFLGAITILYVRVF